MEGLMANISGSCPLAFAGTSGAVFAQAIAAVVAAQCAVPADTWPEDRAEDIFNASKVPPYDFIIVGAGTAGSVLASRLSNELPQSSVLLIEAGDDPGPDSEVPALFFTSQSSNTDWAYKTQPDEKGCQGYKNNECIWSKGRAMGGSSSINAMLYLRGHPSDYDEWEKEGNMNWGYDDVTPYFEKIDMTFNETDKQNPKSSRLYDLLTEAWNETGYGQLDNSNDWAMVGTRINKLLIRKGKRLNTAKVYLQSATQNRNLHIMKKTIAQRVIIDAETRSARSVEVKSENGVVKQIAVRKEVILSAGSIATPQILMLSGIGPSDNHLEEENILDLPVGKNLQDHIMLPLFLQFDESHSVELAPENRVEMAIEYILYKTGPLSKIGITDFMCFANTKNNTVPDVQFHHIFFPKNDEFILKTYLNGVGYKENIINEILRLNEKNSILGIYPTLLHPRSRGEILLARRDPTLQPVIKANYFYHSDDMNTVLRAVRIIQNLVKTTKFQELGITMPHFKIATCDNCTKDSDLYWECYIRHMAATIYHPVGTAKMGSISDSSAVVSTELLVHGMTNLRVVDASVMPRLIGGNTMATTLMIAEKAADIITKYYNKVNDEL